jgi:hypothetical protein
MRLLKELEAARRMLRLWTGDNVKQDAPIALFNLLGSARQRNLGPHPSPLLCLEQPSILPL